MDKRISLWHGDKIPYGTQYAYENLSSIFPNAIIRESSRFPELYRGENAEDTTRALIILSPLFAPEAYDMHSIVVFAASGNQVFISALNFGDTVMSMLHLVLRENFFGRDSMQAHILDPVKNNWVMYAYPGYTNNSYFDSLDTSRILVLGRNATGQPNFIRMAFDHNGAIFIHLDPFVFSNFFLLHGGNKSYYDLAFSMMPKKTGSVEWSDYYRFRRKEKEFSSFRFIFNNRSLRWAFWLTVLIFLLVFLVESKRKQRPITQIPPLRNASEDFVKTVGRLYFQQKNNQNLATKMVAAFLENVRSAYNMSTSVLNDEFVRKLAFRTGRPVSDITQLVYLIHDVRLKPNLTDQELMDLHKQINQFNKPA
jgi:hypothetical protein